MKYSVTIGGTLTVFSSGRNVKDNMRFELKVGDALYLCAISVGDEKVIEPGMSSECVLVMIVSDSEKVVAEFKSQNSAILKFGLLDVGIVRDVRVIETEISST